MRKRRIIIIDDEANIVRLYRDFFTLLGYEVIPYTEPVVCPIYIGNAQSCTKGLSCADIIITDYKMPRMTGLELLREQSRRGCRLTSRNKAVVSAYVDEAEMARIKDLGCSFFSKPVDLQELRAWIAECERRIDPSQPLSGQRKETRRPAAGTRYRVYDAELVVPCSAVNESDSGLCLRLPVPLILDQVRVSGTVSTAPRPASVRWLTKEGDGSYLSGLCYC